MFVIAHFSRTLIDTANQSTKLLRYKKRILKICKLERSKEFLDPSYRGISTYPIIYSIDVYTSILDLTLNIPWNLIQC